MNQNRILKIRFEIFDTVTVMIYEDDRLCGAIHVSNSREFVRAVERIGTDNDKEEDQMALQSSRSNGYVVKFPNAVGPDCIACLHKPIFKSKLRMYLSIGDALYHGRYERTQSSVFLATNRGRALERVWHLTMVAFPPSEYEDHRVHIEAIPTAMVKLV